MELYEKARLRNAASRAMHVLPSGIGELVARELLNWEEFGYRFGSHSLVDRAVREIQILPTLSEDSRTLVKPRVRSKNVPD